MLQISEMRLGNYFLADDLPQTLSAISIAAADAAAQPMIGFYTAEKLEYIPADSQRLQPLPLSNDVMQACGFKFDNYFKRWQKKRKVFGPGVEMELDGDYTALDFSGRPIIKEIQHLHHLQNLYYALKREEMEVQLNNKIEEAYANS